MNKIKTIVFDFDGVIVSGSERAKHQAWLEIFKDLMPKGELENFVSDLEEKYSDGSGDRFDIIKDVLMEKDLPQDLETINSYAKKFSDKVNGFIFEEKISVETLNLLSDLSKRFVLFINSITPQNYLEEAVENLNIKSFFQDVLGRPNSKIQNFDLIKKRGFKPQEMLFLGDRQGDADSAKEFGCDFIGIGKYFIKKNEGPTFVDINQAINYILRKY